MNQRYLFGLGGAALCAIAWLWWSDPSKSVLSGIVAEYQAPGQARQEAVATKPSREEQNGDSEARREVEPSPPLAPVLGKPVSSVRGEVTGGIEVFPNGDRSGVQVYCWPGWYAKQPYRLKSLDDALGIQMTTTDAAGKFSFELYVDDAHWLFAVSDGKCSNVEGMRIGTKPDLQVLLEMRRVFGSHYQVAFDPSDTRPIDLVASSFADLLEGASSGGDIGPERFPTAFFPGTRIDGPRADAAAHTSFFAWADPTAPEPLAATVELEIPGCYPVKEIISLFPVARDLPLPTAELQAVARSDFGELVITARGIPEGLGGPLGAPLKWRMRGTGTTRPFPIKLRSLEQFPLRYSRVPVGEYTLFAREHSGVRGLFDAAQVISIRAGERTELEVEFGNFSFLVFERDAEITDVRFLTPARVRVPNHQETGPLDLLEPRLVVVLAPTSIEIAQVSGSIFLDGPNGPREDGRVTTFTLGIDDD